jgi:hypothetical protein
VADSLIVGGLIELLGGGAGVQSSLPLCDGATFTLSPGFDLGAPQPVVDIVESLILNGERPYGTRASNRTIKLPVAITAPDRTTLAGARETLLELIDQQTWTLTWTRDGGLPLILDCFRASPSTPAYDLIDAQQFSDGIEIAFQALPYGRSDTANQLSFSSPITGTTAPPSAVTLDSFSSVSGTDWSQSTQAITGSYSAFWNPGSGGSGKDVGSEGVASYSASAAGVDITGLVSVGLWAGFGSSYYYYSGFPPVTFAITLHDGTGHTLSLGTTKSVTVSDSISKPAWTYITAHIPQGNPSFAYDDITSYSISLWNSSNGELVNVVAYLNDLQAVPVSATAAAGTRGTIYSLAGITGTAPAPISLQFQQASATATDTFSSPGAFTWDAPAGVTTGAVGTTAGTSAGGGATGSGAVGGGAGGAEWAFEPEVPFTPGNPYGGFVGAGGIGVSGADGNAGQNSYFTGDGGVLVEANTGQPGHANGTPGPGGTGSLNTQHSGGGAGAAGVASSHGGGAGSAGGPISAGNPGSGATGGAAVSGGGKGGNGQTASSGNGTAGSAPGGGGGGARSSGTAKAGGNGAAGQVSITYASPTPFSTLVAHRPGPDSPASLTPFLSVGSGGDVPNGSTLYPVPSLVSGISASFGGTYSFMLTAASWASASSAHTVTITVYQYEYASGPSITAQVSRTFTPSTDVTNGMVTIGELTLPVADIAPDNTAASFAVAVTDNFTSTRYLDCLILDTQGQTCWVNLPSTEYPIMYVDEPASDRDLGRVMGSAFGRSQAVSVLANSFVSGGPLTVDPGNANTLLCYSMTGVPSLAAYYSPRWFLDRLS